MAAGVDASVAAKVQALYAESLKKAKGYLRKGEVETALSVMNEFFDQQELLAEYFHPRTVDEVHIEMMDRLEQAQSVLASILAEHPDRAKLFLQGLRDIVDREFSAFEEMKAAAMTA